MPLPSCLELTGALQLRHPHIVSIMGAVAAGRGSGGVREGMLLVMELMDLGRSTPASTRARTHKHMFRARPVNPFSLRTFYDAAKRYRERT